MRKFPTLLVLGWALLLAAFSGCSTISPTKVLAANPNIVLLDGDMAASKEWRTEAQKRFKNPIIVTVHGSTEDGDWYCFPQHPQGRVKVETLASQMHALHPDNDIVLVICNEDGHVIHVPHVWYAMHKVWVRPTADLYPWEQFPRNNSPIVGDIWKFVN